MRCKNTFLMVLIAAAAPVGAAVADIPAHPSELMFPPLEFAPPAASEHRHELSGGVPVYLAPSAELPLITITFTFRGGSFLEGPEQTGLGSMLGTMMRRGGTTTVPAQDMDERLDFLAANVSSRVGGETSSATVDCLKRNFDEAMALFMDMVRNPGFDEARLRLTKDEIIEQLRQRNDAPMPVAQRTLAELAYGAEHYSGRQPTQASVESATQADLRALHGRIFHPGNLIISATGDFEVDGMLATLEQALGGWATGEPAGDPPAPRPDFVPGLYHTDVAQEDLPQGTLIIFTRTLMRDHPDYIPMEVMNDILGGSGFTSRITNRVRSDEGLAYFAASMLQPNPYYPGSFTAVTMTKNRTVALAAQIMLQEIARIGDEPVGEEELETARNSLIEKFPQLFASRRTVLRRFVDDEMTGRDPEYWQTYRDRIRAITADEVMRVADKYLVPEEMLILIVGQWDEIRDGDLEGRASMSEFFGGNVVHLPMRDPLTLEPMSP